MINRIIFIILTSCYLVGQVAPDKMPYNIESIQKGVENKFIWQKTYNFESDKRVIVKIDSDNCFDELFLINSKGEFSGPYNTQIINKTNPFKAKQLTIQVSSDYNC